MDDLTLLGELQVERVLAEIPPDVLLTEEVAWKAIRTTYARGYMDGLSDAEPDLAAGERLLARARALLP